ncbi:hypothetical protein BDR05DRAFT_895632, partial [Suillus weaverae]
KGCLECSVQDIQSDGSHVEGTHKGWNSLQCAQPSGIVMLSALSHDFVLHQNIRVTSSRCQMMPFVKFTHSSHHIQLSNHITKLYNGLCQKDTWLLPLLLELLDVDSGETFGLVASDNATTFGGLLIKEETLDAKLMHDFEVQTDSFTSRAVDSATEASHSIMIEDWQIDPVLLDQPAAQLLLLHTTNGSVNVSSIKPPMNGMRYIESLLINITHKNFLPNSHRYLFSIATGINLHSLIIQHSDEFYLFMNMWAEFKWLSYQMTSKHWV